jgi:hypothetical protein
MANDRVFRDSTDCTTVVLGMIRYVGCGKQGFEAGSSDRLINRENRR